MMERRQDEVNDESAGHGTGARETGHGPWVPRRVLPRSDGGEPGSRDSAHRSRVQLARSHPARRAGGVPAISRWEADRLDDADAFARWRLTVGTSRGRWHANPTVRAARSMPPRRGFARWGWFRSRRHGRCSPDADTDPALRA